VLQIVAIGLLVLICGVILHKGYADVSTIAREHSGADFWRALARHIFKNLSGA
jgi:hypothetical protein